MDVDKEKREDSSKKQTPVPPSNQSSSQQQQSSKDGGAQQQQPQIDVQLEASKLPLDVAIFNSARAAGGDDKIRKYLQAVLVVGGTALTPGMGHALESRCAFAYLYFFFMGGVEREDGYKSRWMQYDRESVLFLFSVCVLLGMILMVGVDWWVCLSFCSDRLQAIATPLVQNMEKVQIIPPPKDVDKRVLTWKGASVLGRMEGVTDMWVTGADWVRG